MKKRNQHRQALLRLLETELIMYPELKKKALKYPSFERIAHIQAIETALEVFCTNEVKREFVKLKFWGRRMKNHEIATQLEIPKEALPRWRKTLLTILAEKLNMDDL
ncbi:hypothetical protein Dred_0604 [Desulforamulus reducens MI-1]|uniref:Uncharacterized protein n=1 Tax=Desulforamulus reducens (strain ATCC BAA-1160 / DSM 100696 / MI-1) TaxID=349161 RepID=A4J241_DESRM|nr:hypothetical protein [Desulforamulus reducens]ABO49144.1 hypothetical protein Dred_0604 [Desulforamulus reducens MI-1]